MGPGSRPVNGPAEPLEVQDIRRLGDRQAAGRHDEEAGRDGVTPIRPSDSAPVPAIPLGAYERRLETNIAAQVEAIRHGLQIPQYFLL